MTDKFKVRKNVQRGKGHGFIANEKLYLLRCFECGRENWAPAAATGQCAWCGDKPEVADENYEFSMKCIVQTKEESK